MSFSRIRLLPVKLLGNVDPTAYTCPAALLTPDRKESTPGGLGVGATDQAVPLKCSASVPFPEEEPTAQMSVADRLVIALRPPGVCR